MMQDEQQNNIYFLCSSFMACSRFLEMEIAISDERFQKRMESLRPMLIIPHPSFKQDSAEHDIVLIKLTHPLKLNDQVKLAAVPSPTTNRMDSCAVFGWGWSWQNSGE